MPDVTPLALPANLPGVLPPNWIESVRVETSFRTDVTQSYSTGTEERRQMVDRPVRLVTTRYTPHGRLGVARALGMLLRGGDQRQPAPLWCDAMPLTGTAATTNVPCATAYRRVFTGMRVLVFDTDADGYVIDPEYGIVSSFTGSAITLTGPSALLLSHPAGGWCVPCIDGEVSQDAPAVGVTDAVMEIRRDVAEVYGSSALPVLEAGAPAGFDTYTPDATIGEHPIFDREPDWGSEIRVAVVRHSQRVQTGRGAFVEKFTGRPIFRFTMTFMGLDRASAWDLIRFWHSRRGTALPFFMRHPMTWWNFQSTSGSEVRVSEFGRAQDINDFIEYVCLRDNDGELEFVALNSAGDNVGYFGLTCASNPVMADADVESVTSGHFVRFSSDSMTEEWSTDGTCSMVFEMEEVLEEQPVELPAIPTLA